MSSLTCLTCSVAFQDANLGRLHYKTDWHRYNLKRKVAGLSPVTLENFEERQQQLQEIQEQKHIEVISGAEKPKRASKQPLNAASASEPSVNEKEVIENTSEVMEKDNSGAQSWNSSDVEDFGLEECLFCSQVSSSMQENVNHMTAHGFFLPDAEYIFDLEGLITYLGRKVALGHLCLWCNDKGKRFHSTKNVQKHMIDKGHCKMFYEGDAIFGYSEFYDYTSSYPDGKDEDQQVDPNEVVSLEELDGDDYSLTLPSGSVIGHRSLVTYYKQNLVPYLREPTKKVLPKMLAHYKALCWTGSSGLQIEQRAKDLQYMQRMRNRYYTKLGCRGNNLRHHFRDPTGLI